MADLLFFNKPYQVLSQFTDDAGRKTLADYINQPGFYPAGRLDYDSEGLLLLTNSGELQSRIAHPSYKMQKTYWVQVEGLPDENSLKMLRQGIILKDGATLPAKVEIIAPPDQLWPRTPPIRQRDNDLTTWLQISITEGKNRQVRRMTAHIGHPTLRLVRYSIGSWSLNTVPTPGEWHTTKIHIPANNKKNSKSHGKPTKKRRRV